MNAKQGCSPEELERIINDYSDTLFCLCFSYLKERCAAEDAVQDTLIRIFQRCPAFESPQHERAWIMRVAANICKDNLRSAWNQHVAYADDCPEIPQFDTYNEDDVSLIDAVHELKHNYQVVILLYYFMDFKVNEIASMLHTPQSTICVRIMRARNNLKLILMRDYRKNIPA